MILENSKLFKFLAMLIIILLSFALAKTENIVKLVELERDGLELVDIAFSPDSKVRLYKLGLF